MNICHRKGFFKILPCFYPFFLDYFLFFTFPIFCRYFFSIYFSAYLFIYLFITEVGYFGLVLNSVAKGIVSVSGLERCCLYTVLYCTVLYLKVTPSDGQ
jgi:hypothetical protein